MTVIQNSAAAQATDDAKTLSVGMLGFGYAQPSLVMTSEQVGERLGLTADWIIDRTGVRERRFLDVENGEQLVDIAAIAGRDALQVAGRSAAEIDLVIVATLTPDNGVPALSVALAAELGVPGNAIVFDLNAACTGFVTALGHAAAALESGRSKLALVVGADALSRITPWDDPKSAPLFGDAAGAVVVGPVGNGGLGPLVGGFDHQHRILYLDNESHVLRMRGRETYSNAVARMCEAIQQAVDAVGKTLADVTLLVAHQANVRIVEAVGEKLALRPDQVSIQIADVGNTSAASIPVALRREYDAGRFAQGGLILMVGFGGGFVYSAITCELEGIAP